MSFQSKWAAWQQLNVVTVTDGQPKQIVKPKPVEDVPAPTAQEVVIESVEIEEPKAKPKPFQKKVKSEDNG